jgi:hypothetical protein
MKPPTAKEMGLAQLAIALELVPQPPAERPVIFARWIMEGATVSRSCRFSPSERPRRPRRAHAHDSSPSSLEPRGHACRRGRGAARAVRLPRSARRRGVCAARFSGSARLRLSRRGRRARSHYVSRSPRGESIRRRWACGRACRRDRGVRRGSRPDRAFGQRPVAPNWPVVGAALS